MLLFEVKYCFFLLLGLRQEFALVVNQALTHVPGRQSNVTFVVRGNTCYVLATLPEAPCETSSWQLHTYDLPTGARRGAEPQPRKEARIWFLGQRPEESLVTFRMADGKREGGKKKAGLQPWHLL